MRGSFNAGIGGKAHAKPANNYRQRPVIGNGTKPMFGKRNLGCGEKIGHQMLVTEKDFQHINIKPQFAAAAQ
jgi:hypothetical protein